MGRENDKGGAFYLLPHNQNDTKETIMTCHNNNLS